MPSPDPTTNPTAAAWSLCAQDGRAYLAAPSLAQPRLRRVREFRALIAADPERYVRERLDATAARLLGALPAGGAA